LWSPGGYGIFLFNQIRDTTPGRVLIQ